MSHQKLNVNCNLEGIGCLSENEVCCKIDVRWETHFYGHLETD